MERGSDKIRRIVQESIADEDFMAAQKLQPTMNALLDQISNMFLMIEDNMSSFNQPGMTDALVKALKAGIDRRVGFKSGQAKAELDRYFKARR